MQTYRISGTDLIHNLTDDDAATPDTLAAVDLLARISKEHPDVLDLDNCEVEIQVDDRWYVGPRTESGARIAADRPATAYCQRGTQGCCVDHEGDESCETW